ncbi:MAG: hypothetical protein NZL98_03575 [Anaerolineales bacterium]|nr:hypothetical protein [Anaerolineales bacterium]
MSLTADASGIERRAHKTRKPVFLDEISWWVVLWTELAALIAPHAPKRGPQGAPIVCRGDLAAYPLHLAMVQPVEPGDRRGAQ